MSGHGDKFIALAGPRIRPPRRGTARLTPSVDHLPDEHLARAATDEREAAPILVEQLRQDWQAMLPWSIPRPDPARWSWTILPAGLAVVGLGVLVAAPVWSVALVLGGLGLHAATTLRGRSRAIAHAAAALQQKIDRGSELEDLHEDIVDVLRVDPDHDAARLLLAQWFLVADAPLDALMQLAPLRDHHPDEGIVVFLAALSYARLGAHNDAARMLGALRIDPRHPWNDRIRLLERHCLTLSRQARVVAGELEEDL